MKKKRLVIKNKKIIELLKNGGRQESRKDFLELLRRAAKSTVILL